MNQPETWLGDLVRLHAALGPLGPDELAASAEILGMPKAGPAGAEHQASQPTPASPGPDQPSEVEPADHPPPDRQKPRGRWLEITQEVRVKDDRHARVQPLVGLLDGPPPVAGPPPSLFHPHEQRALLAATSAAPDEIGPPDLGRVVDGLARGRPPLRLPRMPIPTHRRGAQLLVDASESMVPFQDDIRALVRALREVAGLDEVEVERFSVCPVRGAGPGPRRSWAEWVPRGRHRPVIVVTDLGIGTAPLSEPRAPDDEWLELAWRARAARTDVLVLVPYPPDRWPRSLQGELAIVQWDRPARVSAVLQARERWRRR